MITAFMTLLCFRDDHGPSEEGRESFVTFRKKSISALMDGQGSVPFKPMPSGGLVAVATIRYRGRRAAIPESGSSSLAYDGSSVEEAGERVVGGGVAVMISWKVGRRRAFGGFEKSNWFFERCGLCQVDQEHI